MSTINGKACVANGRNLYIDTKNFDNPDIWSFYSYWHKAPEKFNGLTVMESNTDWYGLGQDIQAKKGEVYTFSVYARYESGTGNSTMYFNITGNDIVNPGNASFSLNETWQRISATFTVNADGQIQPSLERTVDNTNTLLVAGLKLERGTTATPLTPAPVDKVFSNGSQVYGRNLLTGTGNHTLTNTEKWAADYISNETNDNLLTLFKGLEGQILTVSVDYEYSGFIAGSSQNRLGWEIGLHGDSTLWNGPFYYPNNSSGSGRMYSTMTVPENITSINEGMGYIQFSGSGTGTLSHFKLEKGTVATPWSPAPEDVM